jgi:hypothetical protein
MDTIGRAVWVAASFISSPPPINAKKIPSKCIGRSVEGIFPVLLG